MCNSFLSCLLLHFHGVDCFVFSAFRSLTKLLRSQHPTIDWAVLHVAAPGCAVVTVNGQAIDSGVGICTWTQFQHTVLYSTLDVSGVLVPGENVIGLLLGHGDGSAVGETVILLTPPLHPY